MKFFSNLTTQIILGLFLGCLIGTLLGPHAAVFGELGKIIISLIKAVATPLLFFVILTSTLTTDISSRQGLHLLSITSFNALCALAIGIGTSKFFKAGESLTRIHSVMVTPEQITKYAGEKISFIESLKSYFPESLVKPFVDNAVINLILIALFIGFALKKIKNTSRDKDEALMVGKLTAAFSMIAKAFEVGLGWLVHLAPVAVFGVTAKTVGEFGFEPLTGLLKYVGVGLLGLGLQVLVVYQLWLVYKRVSLIKFWKTAKEAIVYSIGVNSSLATLPLTLKALDNMKVSKGASTLGACVGTNLNNDGILLYEAMAVFFVAQAAGIHLDFSTQVMAAFVCVIGTIGIAGIPDAGFVTLTIVLSTLGLPTELLPILLTVDWILGRARTVVNVVSDMTVSIALDNSPS